MVPTDFARVSHDKDRYSYSFDDGYAIDLFAYSDFSSDFLTAYARYIPEFDMFRYSGLVYTLLPVDADVVKMPEGFFGTWEAQMHNIDSGIITSVAVSFG